MAVTVKIREMRRKLSEEFQRKLKYSEAFIVSIDGNIDVPGKPGYIYVVGWDGIPKEVFNDKAPKKEMTMVRIGADPLNPTMLQVQAVINQFSQQKIAQIVPDHSLYEWPAINTLWVRGNQVLPALVSAKGDGMTVAIYPFKLKMADGSWRSIAYQEVDLTDHIPESGALWVLIEFDQTDGLAYLNDGEMVDSPELLQATDIQAPSDGRVGIAAVAIFSGQALIVQNASQDQIADLRWLGGGGAIAEGSGEGGLGGASAFTDLIDVPSDYTGEGGKVVAVKGSEDGLEFSSSVGASLYVDDLTAQVDGSADHFTTTYPFVGDSLFVLLNGLGEHLSVTPDVGLDGFTLDYAPEAGDILTAIYLTVGGELLVHPEKYILIQDQKAQNTAGGTFTSGAWRKRDLNIIVNDDTGAISLVANEIVGLPAGTYRFRISAPGHQVNSHQARLYNVTDSAVIAYGQSCYATSGTPVGSNSSIVVGYFTISGIKTLRVEHQCQSTQATNGFGPADNFGTEVYTTIELWKVA